MSYSLKWYKNAEKYLESLPRHIIKRILEKFDLIKEEPFRFLEHYEGKGYKFRIGDYRAIIDVDFENKILHVLLFDNRGRVYK